MKGLYCNRLCVLSWFVKFVNSVGWWSLYKKKVRLEVVKLCEEISWLVPS